MYFLRQKVTVEYVSFVIYYEYKYSPLVHFPLLWFRWLLEFGTLLDTSTNTRHLATVSFILPTNLTHLERRCGQTIDIQTCTLDPSNMSQQTVAQQCDK